MIKNWSIYLVTLFVLFLFSAFHSYEQTTWNIFLIFALIPLISLIVSLPFMVHAVVRGITAEVTGELRPLDAAEIKIYSKNRTAAVFPQFKVKVQFENSFASIKKKYRKIVFFGSSKKPFVIINKGVTKHCGTIKIQFKRCAVFDFSGMFFIPLRLRETPEINVMPKPVKPKVMPSADNTQVLGFKPKPGGGFSDYYELRPYREGDSMKYVHWKISSKYDELIVREPSLPVLRSLVIRLDLSGKPEVNDDILARFVGTAEKLVSENKKFFCLSHRGGCMRIDSREAIKACVLRIYGGRVSADSTMGTADLFVIGEKGEEVRGA